MHVCPTMRVTEPLPGERFGSFPVYIIVWFNCWLYAKRKYLLIILQKERSPAGRGAFVRRPRGFQGCSANLQTNFPRAHPPLPSLSLSQREKLSSLLSRRICDGAPLPPSFVTGCLLFLRCVFCFSCAVCSVFRGGPLVCFVLLPLT